MDKEQMDRKENVKNDSYRIKILLGKKNSQILCEWKFHGDVIKI